MSLDIHVRMNEQALAPFRSAWHGARAAIGCPRDAALLERARQHRSELAGRPVAPFLQGHLNAFDDLIRFLGDERWQTDEATCRDLQGALAYFVDPSDLIPDDNTQFGLLDDAIVLELALSGHDHEWSAWREFDRFRQDYPQFVDIDRQEWMQLRNEELQLALRHRRRMQRFERRSYVAGSPLTPFVVH